MSDLYAISPDVAALAAALDEVASDDPEAIIAALAAQGWRLVPSTPASEQLDRIEADYEAKVAASNARIAELSAQAAPEHFCDACAEYRHERCDGCFRAALEGLRFSIDGGYKGWRIYWHCKMDYATVMAVIDARLAALDA